MVAIAPQVNRIVSSEVRSASVSFVDVLDSGEVVTGTPVFVYSTIYVSTLASVAISSTAMIVNGSTASAGQVVTFVVTATTNLGRTDVLISVDTDGGQVIKRKLPLVVEAST